MFLRQLEPLNRKRKGNDMFEKLIKFYKNPIRLLPYLLRKFQVFKLIPDDKYLKIKYRLLFGKELNLNNPKSFNEKLQWLKLNDRKLEYTQLVDKYEVRKYITDSIGNEFLIPLLGVYDNFEEIDFDKLPNQFVLKCTHDSGGVIICKDKSRFDIKSAKKKISKHMKRNYYFAHREWPYKNIKPRIICEKYMEDDSGNELKDYKLMCFNGKVKCTFVCLNRKSSAGLNINIYDIDWNIMPFQRPTHPNSGTNENKPQNYKKMIEFAEILSKDIPFLRVDFYEINGHLYFGELTFYPGSGFEEFKPNKYDELLGSWIQLPIN
jgi:hypothetical protein